MGKRDNGGFISQRSPHKYRHNTGMVLEALWWGRGVNFLSTRPPSSHQTPPPPYTVYYITLIHAWTVSILYSRWPNFSDYGSYTEQYEKSNNNKCVLFNQKINENPHFLSRTFLEINFLSKPEWPNLIKFNSCQTVLTHKYQPPSYGRFLSSRSMYYCMKSLQKHHPLFQYERKCGKKSVHPFIWVCTKS